MNIHEAKITASVLGKEVGWSWPFLMVRCLRRKNGIFKQTHWSEEEGPEVEYIQRLPIVAAAFLELQEKYPQDRALEIMRKVIVPIGTPIARYTPGSAEDHKVGAKIFIGAAQKQPDGSLSAPNIAVGRDIDPPQ